MVRPLSCYRNVIAKAICVTVFLNGTALTVKISASSRKIQLVCGELFGTGGTSNKRFGTSAVGS